MSLQPLRTIDYAMAVLGVSRSTVDKLIKAKQLAAVDVSSRGERDPRSKGIRTRAEWRFTDADLEALIAKRRQAPLEACEPAQALALVPRSRRGPALQLEGADMFAGGR